MGPIPNPSLKYGITLPRKIRIGARLQMSTIMEYANVNVKAVTGKKADWPKGGEYDEGEPLRKWNMRILQALDEVGGQEAEGTQPWHKKKIVHTEDSLTRQLREIRHLMDAVWFRDGEATVNRDEGSPILLAKDQEEAQVSKHRKYRGREDRGTWVRNMLQLEEGRMWEEAFEETEFYWTGRRPAGGGGEEEDSEEEQPMTEEAEDNDKMEEEVDYGPDNVQEDRPVIEARAKAKLLMRNWVREASEVYDPDGGWFAVGAKRINPRSTFLVVKHKGGSQADHRDVIKGLEESAVGRKWDEQTKTMIREAIDNTAVEAAVGDEEIQELVAASCIRGRCIDGTRINIVLQKSYDDKVVWKWDLRERRRRAQTQCIAAIAEVIGEVRWNEYPCEIRIKTGGDELLGHARGAGEPSPIGSVEMLVKKMSDDLLGRLGAREEVIICTPLESYQ